MKPARKFLTKTGYCHILENKIVFTPRGFSGLPGDMAIEGRMTRLLVFFGLLIFYFVYFNYLKNEMVWVGMFAAIGAYMVSSKR